MSTIAVIAIIAAGLIVLAVLIAAGRSAALRRGQGKMQVSAKRDDARHHRERADAKRTDAAVAEERAKRQAVEADLHEERAAHREHEVENA